MRGVIRKAGGGGGGGGGGVNSGLPVFPGLYPSNYIWPSFCNYGDQGAIIEWGHYGDSLITPIHIPYETTISHLALRIGTPSINKAFEMAIYTPDTITGLPKDRIALLTSAVVPNTVPDGTIIEVAYPTTLSPTTYWCAVRHNEGASLRISVLEATTFLLSSWHTFRPTTTLQYVGLWGCPSIKAASGLPAVLTADDFTTYNCQPPHFAFKLPP